MENNEVVNADYQKLTIDEVSQLAREGAMETAELVTKSHLSLAGASGKVGLYYDENNKDWYLPKGAAPSTHIVKQSHVRLDGIVTNEQLCMMTAGNMGIEIPESFIVNVGDGRDEEVLLATKRENRLWFWGYVFLYVLENILLLLTVLLFEYFWLELG